MRQNRLRLDFGMNSRSQPGSAHFRRASSLNVDDLPG
jgi:hypothetical protein